MEPNRWQELNSSTTRIGQEPAQPTPEQAPEDDKAAGGLSAAAKAGFGVGAVALLGLCGFIAFGGSGSEDDQSTTAVADTQIADDQNADNQNTDNQNTDSADEQPDTSLAFADDETSSDDDATGGTTVSDEPADTDAEADTVTDSDTTDQDTNQGTDQDTDASEGFEVMPAVIGADSPPSPPGAPESHSILAGGKIYLRGTLPDPALEEPIVAAVAQIMGPGNVVAEYGFDPASDWTPGGSALVYVHDTILFETASAEIAPDFIPLLALGPTLLQLQPNVTIEYIGHTDSQGSAEANMELSQARVDAVKAWIVDNGGDPDRITATGRGETEPIADNSTPEGRQLNRRVTAVITGFEF